MAATAGTVNLGNLPKEVGAVEFKQTLEADDADKVPPIFGTALRPPQRRKVYFYDTRKLKLFRSRDLALRARVTQNEPDDSTVKVRPASLAKGAPWRGFNEAKLELDVSGKGPMYSARLEGEPKRGEIEALEGKKPLIDTLFSRDQKKLIEAYASDVDRDKLRVLGPVDARKWELEELDGFPYTLCIEEWSLPDTTRFIELSIKVKPKEALRAQTAFHALLDDLEVTIIEGREQKTPRVLEFFANRLPSGN
jgi:hypothetical protein